MSFLFERGTATSPAIRRKLVLVFFYAFSTAGAYVVGRSAADALFLARVGTAWLPMMYLLSACSVGLLAITFLYFAAGRPLKQVILLTLFLLSSSTLVLCLLLQQFDHAIALLGGIYLVAEFRGCLNTIRYGILMNELFANGPDHQYAVGLLSSGATLAGIVFGTIVAFEVHQLGTVQLLYVVAALELLAMIPIVLLPRIEAENSDGGDSTSLQIDRPAPVALTSGLATAGRSSYVRGIAVLVAITVMVGTLIEFQWKSSVAAAYATKEEQITVYFGLYHAVVNLVTISIQVLLTGRLLRHFGTRTALLVFPTALLASTLGVLFASVDRVVLSAITLAKGCDVAKRSVNDPAILMLYAPLSNGPRRQAITFVAGIVKPCAEAAAALLIIWFASIVSTRAISYVALGLLGLWYLAALRHRTSEMNLAAPRFDSSTDQTRHS